MLDNLQASCLVTYYLSAYRPHWSFPLFQLCSDLMVRFHVFQASVAFQWLPVKCSHLSSTYNFYLSRARLSAVISFGRVLVLRRCERSISLPWLCANRQCLHEYLLLLDNKHDCHSGLKMNGSECNSNTIRGIWCP